LPQNSTEVARNDFGSVSSDAYLRMLPKQLPLFRLIAAQSRNRFMKVSN
jgi:hypothetical protein